MSFPGRTPATPAGEEQHGTTLFFQVCRTTLYVCAPFLVPERVQESIVTSIGLSAAQLQYEVCHCLVRDAPAMLEKLHSIARSRCLENGQALHPAAVAVLGESQGWSPKVTKAESNKRLQRATETSSHACPGGCNFWHKAPREDRPLAMRHVWAPVLMQCPLLTRDADTVAERALS
ncbi:uncharacterized protein ACIBXB_007792 [Morphnus guianensis]